MKNLGSIILLLAAAASQVASLPTGEVAHHQIRAANDIAHEIYARVPKKNKDAGKNRTAYPDQYRN